MSVISCLKFVTGFEDDNRFEHEVESVFKKSSVLNNDKILPNSEGLAEHPQSTFFIAHELGLYVLN